jgi:thymidylate kinase
MRVALVGMDGTGKTTVGRRLAEGAGVSIVHTIRPHDDPASPDASLSRHLALASAAADAVGRAQLKVAVFAKQLLLYAPAERRAQRIRAQGIVVADRHPLIDPLIYLPLYARIGVDEDPRDDVDRWWSSLPPATAAALGDEDYWALGTEMIRLAASPRAELLAELIRRFGVRLPDAVVLLDLPVAVALERARARSGGEAEIHETDRVLTAIRSGYDSVLTWLGDAYPETRVRRIDCAGRSVDEVAGAVTAAISR